MNLSFQHKAALVVLLIAACLAAVWRYDVTVVQPRQHAFLESLQNNMRDRDRLQVIIQDFENIRASIGRVAAQGKLEDSVISAIDESFNDISQSAPKLLAGMQGPLGEFQTDLNTFLKITNQLDLYENRIKEFADGFSVYFQLFEKDLARWKEATAQTITEGGEVVHAVPFTGLSQKISTLEKIIPEFDSFQQKLLSLESGFNQWVADINVAPTIEEKQATFGQRQFLLKGFPSLFATFNGYVARTLQRERDNVQQIAKEIGNSVTILQTPFQEQYGVRNNAVQTQMAEAKYKDEQYKLSKWIVITLLFVALIVLFVAMVFYAFRFEHGLALFKQQTVKAGDDSRRLTASLTDHTNLIIKNFELSRTLKEGLEDVGTGFAYRQLNLQHVDQLVRDTEALIKESQENFSQIKEEFSNAEKTSQEIVQLTGALEGVAQQMTSIAERATQSVASNTQQGTAIDELKYLSSRIRHAVASTHEALAARKDKINEAKIKFELVEKNMSQMAQNTQEALQGLALTRLDHSEETSRINEILDHAKATSRAIASEIDALNKQIRDFSVLSKHLDALHELALRASALNAQSLLVEEEGHAAAIPLEASSSHRMNNYIQEYFKKVFENPVLKPTVKVESSTDRLDASLTPPQETAAKT